MSTTTAEVRTKGQTTRVTATKVGEQSVVCTGSWLKVAEIFDQIWLDGSPIADPAAFVHQLKQSGVRADVFTFSQMLPDQAPQHAFHREWDNLAVAPTTDFQAWWEGLPQESRKNVRRSQKRGVTVKPVEFDDALVRGIKGIYDETPIRQGRKFWHYGKDLETIRQENSSYLDRSQFLGAYLEGELIGFLKMVYVGPTARIMQILSKNQHYDKFPMNALLAAAVECCSKKPVAHFIYGQYVYGNKKGSSITEFKRRNGFVEVLLPRYYVPLSTQGRLAIALRLHRGIVHALPEPVINFLLDTRTFAYQKLLPRLRGARAAAPGA